MTLQGFAGAQHLGILGGVRRGEFRGEEVLDSPPHDVARPLAQAIGEPAIDVEVAPVDPLGRRHDLGQPLDQVHEGPQGRIWYRFDTHGVTVAQDRTGGKR